MIEEQYYTYWMVWGLTFEGDKRWQMVRTPEDWSADMVFDEAKSRLGGGVGPDTCEILSVEPGYPDDNFTDYTPEIDEL